jgi:hypothetical protein
MLSMSVSSTVQLSSVHPKVLFDNRHNNFLLNSCADAMVKSSLYINWFYVYTEIALNQFQSNWLSAI